MESSNAFLVLDIIENGPYAAYVKQQNESVTIEDVVEDGFYHLQHRSQKRRRKYKHKMNKAAREKAYICFDDVFSMDNLRISYKRVRRGKTMRRRTVWYHMGHIQRLWTLYGKLKNDTYTIGKLTQFKVYEPKEREVVANQFEDKIVQDVIAKQILGPLFSRVMIHDNYASQPGKGSHMALHRLQRFMLIHAKSVGWTDDGWVMMGDAKKFFYMIDHEIYWKMVEVLPIDNHLRRLIREQIDVCTKDINPYTDEEGKGLCIGFETSQWSAVYYLNKLDHLIKEELGIKCYGRYMDDFYLIHKDRKYLEYCFARIQQFMRDELKMELNKKSYIHPFKQGICFLGYHTYYDASTHTVHSEIRKKSINKMLKRAKKHCKMLSMGELDTETAYMSLQSWHAYAVHGNTLKAKNAYIFARDLIYPDIDEYTPAYRKLCDDWDNLDEDNFFRLRLAKDAKITDVDGFIMLMPHKKSKKDAVREDIASKIQENQERYIRKNLTAMLTYTPRKKKKGNPKVLAAAAQREYNTRQALNLMDDHMYRMKKL